MNKKYLFFVYTFFCGMTLLVAMEGDHKLLEYGQLVRSEEGREIPRQELCHRRCKSDSALELHKEVESFSESESGCESDQSEGEPVSEACYVRRVAPVSVPEVNRSEEFFSNQSMPYPYYHSYGRRDDCCSESCCCCSLENCVVCCPLFWGGFLVWLNSKMGLGGEE